MKHPLPSAAPLVLAEEVNGRQSEEQSDIDVTIVAAEEVHHRPPQELELSLTITYLPHGQKKKNNKESSYRFFLTDVSVLRLCQLDISLLFS